MAVLVILRPSEDERLSGVGFCNHEEGRKVKNARKTRGNVHNDDRSDHEDDSVEDYINRSW